MTTVDRLDHRLVWQLVINNGEYSGAVETSYYTPYIVVSLTTNFAKMNPYLLQQAQRLHLVLVFSYLSFEHQLSVGL